MARLVVRLFGEPGAFFDGKPWKWSAPPRCFPLLALLGLAGETAPTRAWLASTMWPDELESDARSNLRRHLHRLVRALPQVEGVEWIRGDERSIAWNDAAPAWVDVRAFEETIADPARRAEAVDMYRGDLLEGFYDEYVLAERERLRALYTGALGDLIREARAKRDLPSAVRFAERLLAEDEWREDALREWIAAKYESGDRSGALAGYERFARRLRDEFSSEPMPETTALRDAVRAGIALPDDTQDVLERTVSLAAPAVRAPFVGRAEEMEKLRAAWTRAARKSGSVAFVSGEAGIGKSRLVGELVAVVRDQGGHALLGTTSNPEGEPYQAVLSVLRAGLPKIVQAQIDRSSLSSLAGVLPEIHSLRPDLNDGENAQNDRARERLFEAFVRTVAQLGAMRPLCVVLEDLHWAGPATVEVLAALARRVGTLPVLVVATYRSEESATGHPLRELRAKLVSERRAIAMPLERLSEPDVANVVKALAGDDAGPKLGESVARLSEGNPLFVVQLLEGYRETGEIPDTSQALQNVGDVIGARASRLDDEVRAVAETAATVGQTFSADVVADIGGWDENTVLDAVGALIDRALVREAGNGSLEYAFTHALIAASIYECSDSSQRAARHRRAAQILQRRRGGGRPEKAAIARHWDLAGDSARAAAAYVEAAQAELDVYAREEAISHAYAAFDLATDLRLRFEAILIAAKAQVRTGDVERWNRDLQRLESVAASLGIEERFQALKLRERYAAQIADYPLEASIVDAMFALAQRSGNDAFVAEAYYARGYLEGQRGDVGASLSTLTIAREMAAKVADDDLNSRIGRTFVGMLGRSGDLALARSELGVQREIVERANASIDRRLDLLASESTVAAMLEDGTWLERIGKEMLELAAGIGDEYLEARAHATLAHSAYMRRDFAAIRSNYDRAIELFTSVGEMRALRVTYINRSELELRVGRIDEAMRWLDKCLWDGDLLQGMDGDSAYRVNRIEALLLLGRAEEALTQGREVYQLSLRMSERRFVDQALTVLGAAEAMTGDLDAAVGHLSEALALARAREAWGDVGISLSYLVEALLDAGRIEEARRYGAELEREFTLNHALAIHPTRLCCTLTRVADESGDAAGAKAWRTRGLSLLEAELKQFADPADVAAYSSLPFNLALVQGAAMPA
jgi:DNA-binding SARP family transcriptional activator/tetratricopeptide (TPR) repeat protein